MLAHKSQSIMLKTRVFGEYIYNHGRTTIKIIYCSHYGVNEVIDLFKLHKKKLNFVNTSFCSLQFCY